MESQRVVSCCEAVTVSFYANVIAVEEDCLSCEMKITALKAFLNKQPCEVYLP